MIDFQILDAARSFREAAKRAAEQRPSADGHLNVLVFPATHLAVLSCELYVKSMSAEPDYEGDPKVTVARVFARAKRGHGQDTASIDGRIGDLVNSRLDQNEKDTLSELDSFITASRYPYEKAGNISGNVQRALNFQNFISLSDKLEEIISEALLPDSKGNIRLD